MSRGSSSCTSGAWTSPGGSPRASRPRSATSTSRRAEEGGAVRLRSWPSRGAGLAAVLVGLALFAPGSLAQAADPADDDGVHVDFENRPQGEPLSFDTALTGKGGPVRWELLQDESAPNGPAVLTETSGDRTSDRFPLAILKDFEAQDVEVRVRFKPVSGKVDQAAGLVVRLRDPDNYYIARANALEGNVRLYKVVDGRRRQFAGADADVPRGKWQELGLKVEGDRFAVSLDGKELFRATDRTFAGAGRVGLWTKADSVTHFDGLIVQRLP